MNLLEKARFFIEPCRFVLDTSISAFVLLSLVLSFSGCFRSAKYVEVPESLFRLEDFCFIDTLTGWTLSGVDPVKRIYKTTDGCKSWFEVYQSDRFILRSVCFLNSAHGFAGTLDSNLLLETKDGGSTWTYSGRKVSGALKGICSIQSPDSKNVFACGRYSGPAHFLCSVDSGHSWQVSDLRLHLSSAVDCYFFDENIGLIAGSVWDSNYFDSKPAVILTTDGGENWNRVYEGKARSEIAWKISFTDSITGYVSIQTLNNRSDSFSYLKTKDSGKQWMLNESQISEIGFEAQGICFINDKTGFAGGLNRLSGISEGHLQITTNGGLTWTPDTSYKNINRLRKVGNRVIASGKRLYILQQD